MKRFSLYVSLLMLSSCVWQSGEQVGKPVERTRGSGLQSGEARANEPSRLAYYQSHYDVRHYDLDVSIDPEERHIEGTLLVKAVVVSPMRHLVLDMNANLSATRASIQQGSESRALVFSHQQDNTGQENHKLFGQTPKSGQLWIELDRRYHPGETLSVAVSYSGLVRDNKTPPWSDGFVWSQSEDGQPWFGVTSYSHGPDAWWPVKDPTKGDPADHPEEGVSLHFTVPSSLSVVSNGRFEGRSENNDGTATHHWRVSHLIKSQLVTFNVGPFQKIEQPYRSVSGKTLPITYWVLPEHLSQAREVFPQLIQAMNFFEKLLGPYPHQAEKAAFVDTPYLGNEHPSNISYGVGSVLDNFSDLYVLNGWHMVAFHELGHEWWGNLVVYPDGSEFWLSEAFDQYMWPLFIEHQYGELAYHEFMARWFWPSLREKPVVSEHALAYRHYGQHHSISKGVLFLHTLRYLIGDDDFFELLRRQAYPIEPAEEDLITCRQCRITDTEHFERLAEAITGRDLGWLFDLYLYQSELPALHIEDQGERLLVQWRVPEDANFPMPVELEINGERRRLQMHEGKVSIRKTETDRVRIDPDFWVLKKSKPGEDHFGALLRQRK